MKVATLAILVSVAASVPAFADPPRPGSPAIPPIIVAKAPNLVPIPSRMKKGTVSVPALATGHVFNHKLSFWDGLVWPSGNYEFTVVADAGGSVAETNEGDNSGGTVYAVP
jgi:hypothetical protein